MIGYPRGESREGIINSESKEKAICTVKVQSFELKRCLLEIVYIHTCRGRLNIDATVEDT